MSAIPPCDIVDCLVIGGGINGVGIARDAIGRGYSVLLAEKDDLAAGTSSAATKLIHGGLRYLEHYEFRLVRDALRERERLWSIAPHIIWPIRFILPHHRKLRPAWLLRLGLFIYDHIGGRERLPPTRTLDLNDDAVGAALKPTFRKGFEYSDCWVEDARLVVLNARDAAERGADIRTRTAVTQARREAGHWLVSLRNARTGTEQEVRTRMLVNAAGPWVDAVAQTVFARNAPARLRHVRGSHLIIRRQLPDARAFIFQNADGRILFAIPYEKDFTLIGTTDRDHHGDLDRLAISEAETEYLIEAISEYLCEPVTRSEIASTFSGVRPLFDDGADDAQETTRDYVLEVDGGGDDAPCLTVFGGKLTTYRKLAEDALVHIGDHLGHRGQSWTADAPLPGGDFPRNGVEDLTRAIQDDFSFLSDAVCQRLVRAYGTRVRQMLGEARSLADLGRDFGAGLTEQEVNYLIVHEWAETAEDILMRRSKLGLHMTVAEREGLAQWLSHRRSPLSGDANEGVDA
ncbi:MAG: glycerol-3-phosphate dehydrogenase [Pseudomonadota bacterium]